MGFPRASTRLETTGAGTGVVNLEHFLVNDNVLSQFVEVEMPAPLED
jgi:hypothetical protein